MTTFSPVALVDQLFNTRARSLFARAVLDAEALRTHSHTLRQPLTKELPASCSRDAMQIFKNITGYMGDRRSSKNMESHATKLMRVVCVHC